MPRSSKGARLWLEPAEYRDGKVVRHATWVIRDGKKKNCTGCGREDRAGAERALARYIESKYEVSRERKRHPSQILVVDVLNIYLTDKAHRHARPDETAQRILTLLEFWEPYGLSDIDGSLCRAYVKWRVGQQWRSSKPEVSNRLARTVTEASARRELEDLRAAINYHRSEGYCSEIVSVVLPDKSEPRSDWLTRRQAAMLISGRMAGEAEVARSVNRPGNRQAHSEIHSGRLVYRHPAFADLWRGIRPAIGRGLVEI